MYSDANQLSFPQAERVGNPSRYKERFRTSRNDKPSGTYVALYNCGAVQVLTLVLVSMLFLFCASSSFTEAAEPSLSPQEKLRLGEQMYREGILPSGEPMMALVQGDIPVAGTAFTCVSCHLRSGIGSLEGGVATPPTNGATLFRTVRKLHNGVEVATWPVRRPAYTDETLAKALWGGVDATGRVMDEVMPRYQLTDEDMAILIYYLKWLSSEFSPGVSNSTLRLATVITDDVSPDERDTMLLPLQDYVKFKNNAAERQYSKERLVLSQWLLKGPPGTWRAQLEEYHKKEPVFALVGGITKKEWQPVHNFSEEHKIPCILPVTDFPVLSGTDWYTLYFSKGFYQEGEAAARYLNDKEDLLKGRTIVQVVRDAPEGRALSAGFRETWRDLGHKDPVTVTLKAGESLTGKSLQQVMTKHRPAALLLWAGSETLPALETLAGRNRPIMAFVSAGYLGESIRALKEQVRDFTYITYPYRLPEAEKRYTAIVRSTLGPAYEKGDNLITSKKTYTIIRVLTQALASMAGQYYRDALLDSVDMGRGAVSMGSGVQDETYPLYQRFSFGPGQRYASKGCYIVQLSKGPEPELVRRSDWVIH